MSPHDVAIGMAIGGSGSVFVTAAVPLIRRRPEATRLVVTFVAALLVLAAAFYVAIGAV